MKKQIHPFKNKTVLIHTKKNATAIPSIYNVNKLHIDMDVFMHYLYNKHLDLKSKSVDDTQHGRLRLFKLK